MRKCEEKLKRVHSSRASQLDLAIGESPKHPVWENLTFHIPSHPTIYIYPYTHDRSEERRVGKEC